MPEMTIQDHVKTIIQTQVIQALNSAPEAIEKLVKAALSKEVDRDTGKDGYSAYRVPYLDWLVGDEIRTAATFAVREVIKERKEQFKEFVRKSLSSQNVVDLFAKAVAETAEQSWKIDVKFVQDK